MSSSTRRTPSPLLGSIAEVCLVTPDLYRTMDGLTPLGIGPFQVFKFDSETVSDRIFRDAPGDFSLLVAFAKNTDGLVFEIMQPTGGTSLMSQYLNDHGGSAGIQHVAFGMGDLPMDQRIAKMKQRGFEVAMQGVWKGKEGQCHFVFFDTLGQTGTVFESIEFSDNWQDPEFEWYPQQPNEGENGNPTRKNF